MTNEKMEKPDFSKIWGENGNVTYKFSDDNYLKGWGFVGNIPPARGMFDAYFQGTDKKLKWLDNALGDYVNSDYTIDDTKNPTDNKDTLPNLLSGMANMIKTTNGTDDWKKTSATSLKDLSDQIASNNLYHAEATGYGIVSGCEPSINGLTVTVSAGVIHTADGRRVEVPEQSITLDAADATKPRTDVVYLDKYGKIAKLTGKIGTSTAPGLMEAVIKVGEIAIKAGAVAGAITASYNHYKTATITYHNVSMMRQDRTLMPGMVAHTLGYYAPNDGGGAVYIIRAKTDNDADDGGSIIVLDNGSVAELLVDDEVNVKQFGARGDGATDDTNAFARMLKYENCYIPLGNYVITSPLVGQKTQRIVDLGTYTEIKPCYSRAKGFIPDWEHAYFRKWAKSRVIPPDYYLNGACYNDKSQKWVITACKADNTKQKIMILNNTTYSVESTFDYTTLRHANTLAYCPDTNTIYIPLNDSAKTIARIDATTYAELPPITINEYLYELYYDRITKVFVGTYTPAREAITRVYVYDANFTLLNTFDVNMGTYHELNGGCAHNGCIVFCTTSGDVYECDMCGNTLNKLGALRDGVELEDADFCVDTGHIHYFARCPNWETTYNAFATIECTKDKVFMAYSPSIFKNRYLIGETFDSVDGIKCSGYKVNEGFINVTIPIDEHCPKGNMSIVDTTKNMSIISTTSVVYSGTIDNFISTYSAKLNFYAERNHITIEILSTTGAFTMPDKIFTIVLESGVSLRFVSDEDFNS